MAVGISGHEAQIIARFVGLRPAKVPKMGNDLVNRVRSSFSGVPCTFLKDNECTIYSVRPLACRVHLSTEIDARPCEVNDGVEMVHYVNLRQLEYVGARLFARSHGYADIREFFPHTTP
jgi:Fe-S-cluster containining protein